MISGREGLTAMPCSDTNTSTTLPGVVTVVTFSTTVGILPLYSGPTMMVRLAPAAASGWPPIAPMTMPSEPVTTLTLKLLSISSAERMQKSS